MQRGIWKQDGEDNGMFSPRVGSRSGRWRWWQQSSTLVTTINGTPPLFLQSWSLPLWRIKRCMRGVRTAGYKREGEGMTSTHAVQERWWRRWTRCYYCGFRETARHTGIATVYCWKAGHHHSREEALEIWFMIKKHRRRIILPQHGKDTSDEMKHAAANRDCCWARIHFCEEKGGRVGAAAMGKREEEGHPSDGGRGGDGMLLLWCLREGERRRWGGFIAAAAACVHAIEVK